MLFASAPVLRADVIGELLAPPTAEELAAYQAAWLDDEIAANDVEIELDFMRNGDRVLVVSHRVGSCRNYAAIRIPPSASDGKMLPVLLQMHGGGNGGDLDLVFDVEQYLVDDCVRDHLIVVVPAFRGEPLLVPEDMRDELGFSEWIDASCPREEKTLHVTDVVDSMSLIDVVLDIIPVADEHRIGVLGKSRGASVAMHTSIRDRRVRTAIAFFGSADMFMPACESWLREAVAQDKFPDGGATGSGLYASLFGYVSGEMTFEEARSNLLRRSSGRFGAHHRRLQCHHGLEDKTIWPEHTMALEDLMGGYSPISFEANFYPGVAHNGSATMMVGSAERVSEALCELAYLPPRCVGDVDEDGVVNGSDLAVLLGAWGAITQGHPADWNEDGTIDGADLAMALGFWGGCT